MKTPLLAIVTAGMLSGCYTYGKQVAEDPSTPPSAIHVADTATLTLRSTGLEIVSIDGEALTGGGPVRFYSGRRTVVVAGVVSTNPLRETYLRVPLSTCYARLEFSARPLGRYVVVAEDLWRHDPKVQILDEDQGSPLATVPCTGRV
jgi:hypothetical protein